MPRCSVIISIIFLLLIFVEAIVSQKPCMNVVNYLEQQNDRFLADIVLKDPQGLEGVWLNFTMDRKIQIIANNFGPCVTADNRNYAIKRLGYNLTAGATLLVRVMVKHNPVNIPYINKILLNGRSICPASIEPEPEERQCPFCPELKEKECNFPVNNFLGTPFVNNQTVSFGKMPGSTAQVNIPDIKIVNVKKVCGTVTITKDKIHGGLLAEEGNYPWQIAIIYKVTTKYICSAGLISQKFALTAAHCVTKSHGSVAPKQDYVLYAGITKLNDRTENVQIFQLSSIEVHEDYNATTFENDIAILGLRNLARIDDYVRPICLPTEKMNKLDMYDRKGIVAGWGYTKTGLLNDLHYANMPIVSPDICIYSDRIFYSLFISPKVFCAGARNVSSVCLGDSGAPLALESTEIGDEDKHYIRGIVSLSKLTFGLKCSPSDFAIYTDVKSYMPWINHNIDLII